MKRLVLISFVFLILVITPFNTAATPVYGDNLHAKSPSLAVRKWISTDSWASSKHNEILIGSSITVHVNLTNMSNHFARNITILEPIFSPGFVNSQVSYKEYDYLELGFGATVNYTYTFTPKVTGNFTIEPTSITYLDVNGTQFTAKSTYIHFAVLGEPPKDTTPDLWKNMLLICSIFVAIPLLVFIANFVIYRR